MLSWLSRVSFRDRLKLVVDPFTICHAEVLLHKIACTRFRRRNRLHRWPLVKACHLPLDVDLNRVCLVRNCPADQP